MIEINFNINAMQLWLGGLVTNDQMTEISYLRERQANKRVINHNFLYEYSIQGESGFIPLITVKQQAFCQALAHLGCIPSILLFGFSLQILIQQVRAYDVISMRMNIPS